MSEILFACLQDPFYRLIEEGVRELGGEGPSRAGIVGYVDDTTVLVGEETGLGNVGHIIEVFGAATGMRVNGVKSKLLEVGTLEAQGWNVVDRIKICGVVYMGKRRR